MQFNRLISKVRFFFLKNNRQGTAMLFVIVVAFIGSILLSSIFFSSRYTLKKSGRRRDVVNALNIAEAGKERILAQLRNREIKPFPGQDTTVYSNVPFNSGSYTVRYSTNDRNDTIQIFSIGVSDIDTAEILIIALLTPFYWRSWVKGAVTLPNPYSSLGDFVVDGRDHDTTGVLGGPGSTYGVSSGGSVSPSGSSLIGGGDTPPQDTAIDGLNVQSNIDTTGYPRTPEEVLGLPAGALDSYITSCPSTPLSGITYVTDGCGDYSGSGILICHNSTGTATLDNWTGDFKGLIISDAEKHFNGNDSIIGAVVLLGRKPGGNTFGNGNTEILYSSLMIEKVVKDAYDIDNKRWLVPTISWHQIR